jgi:hypothetical protein
MRFKRLKKVFIFLILAICIFGSVHFYYRLTDGFQISHIMMDIDEDAYREIPPLSQSEQTNISKILNQKFYYLGKGAQCYAFLSEDGDYVLKFFKFKYFKPSFFVNLIPSIPPFHRYKVQMIEKKKRRIHSLFESCRIAYQYNKEGAALVVVHLRPTKDRHQVVTIVDKIGFIHQIDLDSVLFLVQKRGETLQHRLTRELDQHNLDKAKRSIHQILAMHLIEYQKGLFDRDAGVLHNTGFIQDTPFHLDIGRLSKDEQIIQLDRHKQDLQSVIGEIDHWMKINYPDYQEELSAYLKKEYEQYVGELLDFSQLFSKRLLPR